MWLHWGKTNKQTNKDTQPVLQVHLWILGSDLRVQGRKQATRVSSQPRPQYQVSPAKGSYYCKSLSSRQVPGWVAPRTSVISPPRGRLLGALFSWGLFFQ